MTLTATSVSEFNGTLETITATSDYFAREALAWVKKHPDDLHDADVVGVAMRVVRNG